MVCFSDQSRTSRTRRRALASPSAATRMFLNSAQCWNAPRAGVSGVKETLRTSGGSPSENEDDADAEARAAGGPKPANELARPAAPTIGGNVDVHTTSVTDAPGWYCRETRTRGRGADARVSRGEADGRYALARARSVGRDRRDRTRCQSRHAISRAIAGPTLRRDARGLPGPYLQGRANRVHPRRRIFYDHHLAGYVPLARASGRETKPERRERLPKKTKRQRCISAWICTDDVVEEWNDRRRAGRRVSPLSASPRSARASFPGALHLRGAQHELRPVLEELAERAHRAGRPQARARFLLREDGAR